MRGRKPTPTALHLLRGNPGKRKRNRREPTPPVEQLAPPAWLAPEAQHEWTRLAPLLTKLGVLTATDADALAAYCEAWTTWKQATQRIRQDGMVLKKNVKGVEVLGISPYMKIAHHAMSQMRALLVEFGMTPSARARIHTADPPKPESKWGGHL
jgi:P27 family predicted phage terminase small subunit